MTPMSAEASRRALPILSGLPTVGLQVLLCRGGPREVRVDPEQVGPARLRLRQDLDVRRPDVEDPAVTVLANQAADLDRLEHRLLQVAPQRGLDTNAHDPRSDEHPSELQSLMRISYAV